MGLFDRLRGDDNPRVAFFGIDGVPYSLVADHPEEFPNLHRIIEEGAAGPIDSIVPPESSACWPALTTGKNPGETGVYGFQDRETGSYDTYVPVGRDVQARRIWDVVADEERGATVMNVPVTFPPQRNVTRMVSGFLSSALDRAAHPPEFRDELDAIGYRIDVDPSLGHREDKSAFVEDAHETVDRRQEAFMQQVDRDDWDLFFGVFMTTDRVNHFMFGDYERDGPNEGHFMDFYRKVDRYLGELRDALDDDVTMVVASDHGFTTLDYEVHCNTWLEREGWLSYRDRYDIHLNGFLAEAGYLEYRNDDPNSVRDLAPDTEAYAADDGQVVVNTEGGQAPGGVDADRAGEVANAVAEDLRELEAPDGTSLIVDVDVTTPDPTTDDIGTEPAKSGPVVTVSPNDDDRTVVFHADFGTEGWLETGPQGLDDIATDAQAYSLIPGRFYLNLEGREPRGSVPQEEYEAVRSELKSQLEALKDPDGRPVAERVVTKEDAYRGDHDAIAPDLTVVPAHGFDLKSGFGGDHDVFDPDGPRNGMHSFDNASLFVDDPRVTIHEDTDLLDIAPTLLDLLEIDYARAEYDGGSLV
jgi:predicted AlkP superfamily phosphohydrolase/phosphomutase